MKRGVLRRAGRVGRVLALFVFVGATLLGAAFPEAALGGAWLPVPSLNGEVPQGVLQSVSCSSERVCIAVGYYINGAGAKVTLAERWDGTSWTIQPTPDRTGASDSELSWVSCPSESACIAVGHYTDSAGTKVLFAERWDGTSWTTQATPNPNGGAGDSELLAVSCSSERACTAVGYYATGVQRLTLAERWDGASWTIQATPDPPGMDSQYSELTGVSCTSTGVCTAVGDYENRDRATVSLAERWDGTSWAIQSTPNPSGTDHSGLLAVSCASASTCAAVGDYRQSDGSNLTLAERWDGTSWTIQPTPSPSGASDSELLGVSCTSADRCIAVGLYQGNTPKLTLAERWDGTSWTTQDAPNPTGGAQDSELSGVSCSASGTCTAVGYATVRPTTNFGRTVTLAGRWDGTSWSVQSTPNPDGASPKTQLQGISCTSASACIAVGDYVDSAGTTVTLAERWDGASWTIQSTPSPPGWTESELLGVSCTSSSACTAVGYYSDGRDFVTLAERWDGTSWTIQPTPNRPDAGYSELLAVSCMSTSDCTAVGRNTRPDNAFTYLILAERWDGTSWTIEATPEPAGAQSSQLVAVSCTSANACTGVGTWDFDNALAERWDGMSWSIQPTPDPAGAQASHLIGVSCASVSACTAVGNYVDSGGTYLTLGERWDGTSWSIQPTPNPNGGTDTSELMGVSCPSMSTCTAVGNYDSQGQAMTLAERWDGTSWTIQSTPTPPGTLFIFPWNVSCPSASACITAGEYTDIAGDRSWTAHYDAGAALYALNVTQDGSGQGSLSSTPPGIDCGIPCSHPFDGGTAVVLTAMPGSGSRFAGWSGSGCSGSGSCQVVMNSDETVTATFTEMPPASISPPSISGSTTEGQTLTESHGSWSNHPSSYSYQWQACDSAGHNCQGIASATGQNYTLTGADVGLAIRVQETASNDGGTSSPATSPPTGVVQPLSIRSTPPSNSLPPAISGMAQVGQRLLASTGTWSGTQPIAYRYQWQRCAPGCSNIAGAITNSLVLTEADAGKQLRVLVTAANSAGSSQAASSQVGPVVPPAPRISALRLSPVRLRAELGGPSILFTGKKGTKVTYQLSQPATVTFTIEQALPGRKSKGRCLPDRPARHRLARCTRYVLLSGSFRHRGRAGNNTFRFTGRLANRSLKPGNYRLIATARNTFGNLPVPIRVDFTILPQHRSAPREKTPTRVSTNRTGLSAAVYPEPPRSISM